ncbi:MAG TPA: Ig-like domain-containing protein [Gemmatimonadaceae bacterium]|nr:Ig-like domain-containing protein [Gemmatimonadaceae bacterium]
MKSRPSSAGRAVLLGALLAVFGACTLNVDVDDPAILVKNGGEPQSAPVNTALAQPLSVLVTTQFGKPLAGVTVNWSIAAGGGSLDQSSSQTSEGGIASVNYTTGSTPGTAQIKAEVPGLASLIFTVTIT